MASLIASLTTELLNLSNEAKRKNPEIKDASERLLQTLRTLKETPDTIISELAKSEEHMKTFLLSCESKNAKLVSIAIGCLQKIISHHALPPSCTSAVLKTLTEQKDSGMELQLKILQTILPLVMNYPMIHGEIMAEALILCYKLQDTKAPVINNTAAATFRQLVLFVFEKLALEDAQQEANPSKLCFQDAYLLFNDICALTSGETPNFLKIKEMTKVFGLELIESVLSENHAIFKRHMQLGALLKDRVCPLTIKSFSEKLEYCLTVRLMRVSSCIIKHFHDFLTMESEILLSMFGKILEAESALYWHKVLTLESIRAICIDGTLHRSVFSIYDGKKHSEVFKETIQSVVSMLFEEKNGLLAGLPPSAGGAADGKESRDAGEYSFSWAQSGIKVPCIEQLDKTEIPNVPDTYHLHLAIQSISALSDNQVNFIMPTLQKTLETEGSIDLIAHGGDKHDDIMLAIEMVKIIGPMILAGDTILMLSNIDDESFQVILKSLQSYTVIIGLLGLIPHRDAFLASLCKICVPHGTSLILDLGATSKDLCPFNLGAILPINSLKPYSGNLPLNERHVIGLKSLLAVADSLQTVLENRAWYAILETFQFADNLVSTGKVGKREVAAESKDAAQRSRSATVSTSSPAQGSPFVSQVPPLENQFIAVSGHIKKFFEKTKTMHLKNLLEFVRALCQLAQETAIGASMTQSASSNNAKDFMKVAEEKSFAVSKLLEVATGNVTRLVNSVAGSAYQLDSPKISEADIWHIIIGQLIEIAHTPASTASIRSQACIAFGEILTAAIQVADLSNPVVELRIIEPIKDLILIEALSPLPSNDNSEEKDRNMRYGWLLDVQKSALDTLNRILQAGGQKLSKGWLQIFDVIQGVVNNSKMKKSRTNELAASETNLPEAPASQPSGGSTATSSSSGKLAVLVRLAFPSLELICSDFLALLSPMILSRCIETVGLFGAQSDDLNISLTAIRLLWSLSDFVLVKKLDVEKRQDAPVPDPEPVEVQERTEDTSEMTPLQAKGKDASSSIRVSNQELFDGPMNAAALGALWMYLLAHLSQLCSDSRPEVRNSANQSLFGSINLNGKKLTLEEWDEFTWNVLFPLLQRITTSSAAEIEAHGSEKKPSQNHHSRNTPSKQWDETKVLTLNGVSKYFVDYIHVLADLGPKFDDAWANFLSYIHDSCVSGSQEVATAATKSFRLLLHYPKNFTDEKPMPSNVESRLVSWWTAAWDSWIDIVLDIILLCDENSSVTKDELRARSPPSSVILHGNHTQETLHLFATLVQDIHAVIYSELHLKFYEDLLNCLSMLLMYHTNVSDDPAMKYKTLIPNDLESVTPLQQDILDYVINYTEPIHQLAYGPEMQIKYLSFFVSLPFTKERRIQESLHDSKGNLLSSLPSPPPDEKLLTYEAFSKRNVQVLEGILERNSQEDSLYTSGAFESALASLVIPMSIKYDSAVPYSSENPPIWRFAVSSFVNVANVTLDSLGQKIDAIDVSLLHRIYENIVGIIDAFLLSPSQPRSSIPPEDLQVDEAIDMKLLDSIANDFIWFLAKDHVSDEALKKLIGVICRGCRLYDLPSGRHIDAVPSEAESEPRKFKHQWTHSQQAVTLGSDVVPVRRISFAMQCIKSLFYLCSKDGKAPKDIKGHRRIAELASPILIDMCEEVLQSYIADRPLLGKMPMPRIRNEELFCILTHLRDMNLEPSVLPSQEDCIWRTFPTAHLFKLYPVLLDLLGVLSGSAWVAALGTEGSVSFDEGDLVDLSRACLALVGRDLKAR